MQQAVVIYDGDCGLCRASRRFCEALDWLRSFAWVSSDDPAVERYGVPRLALLERLYLVQGVRQWSGFAAVRRILLRLPLAAPFGVVALLMTPIGERAYNFVARRRYCRPGV